MIVCWRTVRIPVAEGERFGAWVQANRAVRDHHGNDTDGVLEAVVVTAWASHDAFDAWINTPDRDRLTASPVHQSVTFGPITRYVTTGGYLNRNGLRAISGTLDAVADTRKEQP